MRNLWLNTLSRLSLSPTTPPNPGFYLFNSDRLMVYRGQIDSSRPGKALI